MTDWAEWDKRFADFLTRTAGMGDAAHDLVGERTRLRARQGNYADRYAFAQHRNAEHSAKTAQSLRFGEAVIGVCLNVGNVNHGPFQ